MTVAIIITWVAFALWAAKIGYQKGHFLAGVILGGTLAYVGVAIIALFPASRTHSRELPSGGEIVAKAKNHTPALPSLPHMRHGKHAA